MSKRIHLALSLIAFLFVAGWPPSLALAQDEPPQPAPATDQRRQETRDVEAGRLEGQRLEGQREPQQKAGQAGPTTGMTPTPLKEFKPTDKIGADSAVSFPVDI